MKKILKSLSSLMLVLLLCVSMCVPAFAETSDAIYFGREQGFVFQPGGGYTNSDLFDGFKAVMPGDTLSETVYIKNESRSCDYIKVYIQAAPHDEANPVSPALAAQGEDIVSMQDFLSQLSMRVYYGERMIYNASPDQLGGFAEKVYLGTVRRGRTALMDVVLEVPIELGNEYANRAGEVDWIFTAEEFNDPPLIQTGQLNWPVPVLGAAGLLMLLLGLGLIFKQRKRENA